MTTCCEAVGGSNVANGHVWCVGCNCLVDGDCDEDGALADCPEKGQVSVVCALDLVGELGGVLNGEIDTAAVVTVCCSILFFSQNWYRSWVNDSSDELISSCGGLVSVANCRVVGW